MKLAVRPAQLLADVSAGTVVAMVTISYAASYATLIFSGPELRPYLPLGFAAGLTASWLMSAVVALGSSWFFAVGGPDSNLAAVLAAIVPAVLAGLTRSLATPVQIEATLAVVLPISAAVVGFSALLIGLARQGQLARFVPYPVSGGVLAGTGFLIASGGLKVLTGASLSLTTLSGLGRVPATAWASATFVLVALLLAPRISRHFLVMPIVLLLGGGLFYACLLVSGGSVADARTSGLLLSAPHGAAAEWVSQLASTRWDAIGAQWTGLLALAGVGVVTVTLNSTALEMDTDGDVDFDRELRVSGLAALLTGAAGGLAGAISLSRTSLNRSAGASSRLSGLWAAVVVLLAVYPLRSLLGYVPTPVLAGLLMFLGLSMMRQWLWDSYFRLPLGEYLLVLIITLAILFDGLIAGVGVGLLAAACLFVYHYGKTETIRNLMSGAALSSNRERTPEEISIVHERGAAVRVLCLQGYLFFGTSSTIVGHCRQLVREDRVRYLVVDFRLVQGLDVSSIAAFSKLAVTCERGQVMLLFSDMSAELQAMFVRSGMMDIQRVRSFEDLDRALEWIEDRLLIEAKHLDPSGQPILESHTGRIAVDINELLERHFSDESIKALREYCEAVRLQPGEALLRQGDPGEELFIIEEGFVSVLLRSQNGRDTRLRTFGPGTIVGEMAVYTQLSRSADVVADTPCRVWVLRAKHLSRMERVDPALAIQFHAFIVKVLASRLGAANREIQALR